MNQTCEISADVHEAIKTFRFKKSSAKLSALILKIDELTVHFDQLLEDTSFEELADELPDNTPRYLLLSYELKHADGRY